MENFSDRKLFKTSDDRPETLKDSKKKATQSALRKRGERKVSLRTLRFFAHSASLPFDQGLLLLKNKTPNKTFTNEFHLLSLFFGAETNIGFRFFPKYI